MKDTACYCTNVSRSRVFIEVDCGSPSRPVNGYIQGALFTAGKEVFYTVALKDTVWSDKTGQSA